MQRSVRSNRLGSNRLGSNRMGSNRMGTVGVAAAAVAATAVAFPTLAQGRSTVDLTTLRGELGSCGDGYCLDGHALDFGPAAALSLVAAAHDYDRNGTAESLADEVSGLVGADVVLEVVQAGAQAADVHTIGGLPYRDADEPPPWLAVDKQPVAAVDDGSTAGTRHDGVSLQELSGTLERCGSAYCVGGTVVDFAPRWYLQTTPALDDLDGDGVVGTLADEIAGLAGSWVVVEVEAGRMADVHTLNGVRYRGDGDGPPAWAGGPFAREGPGPPADRPSGPPAGAGRPEGAGPPADTGPPADAGPPAAAGRPEGSGPFAGEGRPAALGPPAGAGKPADGGPSPDAGRPGGRPDRAASQNADSGPPSATGGRPPGAGGPP